MTTWLLSELGCRGNCQQGRQPCDCLELEPKEIWHFTVNEENGKTEIEAKWELQF